MRAWSWENSSPELWVDYRADSEQGTTQNLTSRMGTGAKLEQRTESPLTKMASSSQLSPALGMATVSAGREQGSVARGWRSSPGVRVSSFSCCLCLGAGYLTSLGLRFLLCKAGREQYFLCVVTVLSTTTGKQGLKSQGGRKWP